jgi:hypothetical protein
MFQQFRMRRGQASDRNARRRARYIIQLDMVAEADRLRMDALFAADADLQVRAGAAAEFCGHLHQLADAFHVEHFERVVFE